MVKSYSTYVNFVNKILLYVLTPIASFLIIAGLFKSKVFMNGHGMTLADNIALTMGVGGLLIAMGIGMVYVFVDHSTFSASLSKKSNFIEYIKSSSVGGDYFRNVVISESIIRIINFMIIGAGLILEIYLFAEHEVSFKSIIKMITFCMIVGWATTSLIIAIIRHIVGTQTAMIIAYLVLQAISIGVNVVMAIARENHLKFILNNPEIIGICIFALIGVASNAYVIWKTNVGIKNWYIDDYGKGKRK